MKTNEMRLRTPLVVSRQRRRVFNLIVGLFLMVKADTAYTQDRLAIVTPHWEGIRYEFGRAFESSYRAKTGRTVKVEWMDVGGTSEILQYLFSEYRRSPNGIGIDMLFGGGTDPFVQLKRAGLLEEYHPDASILAGVANQAAGIQLHDSAGFFYSPVMAGFGFMCNLAVLKTLGLPTPKQWEDLTTPPFRSWIGSADPRRSGSIHMAYEVILQSYGWNVGWDLIYRLSYNTRSFIATSTQLTHDIANGELACGFAIDSQATAQARELGPGKISFTVPAKTPVVNGDALAILKGTRNQSAARAFIDFMLSDAGQKIWYLRVGVPGGPEKYSISRLPVRPSLYAESDSSEVTLKPFEWSSEFHYDAELGAKRWRILNDIFAASVLERLSFLQNKPLADSALPPPVSQLELDRLLTLSQEQYAKERLEIFEDLRISTDWRALAWRFLPVILLGALLLLARRRASSQ